MASDGLAPDWDWQALHDRLMNLATIAYIIDATPMDRSTRLLSLGRLAQDTEEALKMANFVLAREKGGEDWWRSETTKP
ncbi:hypothetical protein HLK59_32605 [Streptomyces sp. S3(2020)]|uniref:hypothetical protein n=1 Tax=Streptomyces sp. S3(2020) TaxID=2732044 RepID=UPI001488E6EB|nr:hypothetical protein [Streptomyces sp. S3(2020)]NNN35023.1 hypothetical protein [Streptomyces sp. S3(2020)]